MGGCLDQVIDSNEPKDLSLEEENEKFPAKLYDLSEADTSLLNEHNRNAANKDSTLSHLPDLEVGSKPAFNPLSPEEHKNKLRNALSNRIEQLRNGESTSLSATEIAVKDDGTITNATGDPISKAMQEQLTRTLELQEAARLENSLILDGSGGVLEQAIDRLVEEAGADLPPDFEGRLTDWLHDQFRQRAGNEEARRLGLKDVDGNPLVFPCAEDDDESTSDEKLAATLNAYTDAYEKHEKGELSGNAVKGYAGDKNGELWKTDWRSCLAGVLTPVQMNDQKQIGSCAQTKEIVAACKRRPDLVAEELCGLMTEGSWTSPFGTTITAYPDELGRGGPAHNNGQSSFVFLMDAGISSAWYGDGPNNNENGIHHMHSNNSSEMSVGAKRLYGYGVEDGPGTWCEYSPGHAMASQNEVGPDGQMRQVQHNTWNEIGASEPGEGEKRNYGHSMLLDEVNEKVDELVSRLVNA